MQDYLADTQLILLLKAWEFSIQYLFDKVLVHCLPLSATMANKRILT